MAITCQFLIDLQNSSTAVKSGKFPTKFILGYPPHLKYVAALPRKNKHKKFCTIYACKTCFRSDFYHLYSRYLSNVI